MTKYLNPTFNSGANSKEYRDNWEKIFGKKKKTPKFCTWGEDDGNAFGCTNEAMEGEDWCEYHLSITDNVEAEDKE